ncbi:MAG: ABC transporter substrate-binding protein [Anaerolineales bacterium]
MNTRGLWRARLVSIGVLSLVLMAIGLGPSLTYSAPGAQQREVVRIGLLFNPGSAADRGARLALATIGQLSAQPDAPIIRQYEPLYPNRELRTAEDVPPVVAFFQEREVAAIIGPVDSGFALPNLEPLARAGRPVLTLSTANTLTDVDVTNNIMRFRPAERFYSAAAADYMLNDLGLVNIALVQTNIESTEALLAFERTLDAAGRAPATRIQLVDNTELEANIPAIIDAGADAVAIWGPANDAATLRRELTRRGWEGTIFYRNAQEALLNNAVTLAERRDLLGASAWTYATPTELSEAFLLEYLRTYGRIPTDEAAAAYDAVFTLYGQIQSAGSQMPGLYDALLTLPRVEAVQGGLVSYGDGDFARSVTVYRVLESGGVAPLARYEDGIRLDDAPQTARGVALAVIGTPTFTPEPSPTPTQTPQPSPTPTQMQLTTTVPGVRVFAGPGEFFAELGDLPQGTTATILGADELLAWLVIQYRGGIGWVFNNPEALELFDPGGLLNQLPIIEAQPTPIGGVSPTPAVEAPDVVIDEIVLTPAQPIPGQTFLASVTLRNAGRQPTGPFSVATTFQPGSVFSSNNVPNIEPGASVTLPLSAAVTGTGTYTVDVRADVNNTVAEGEDGEANNSFPLSYTVDFPVLAERQDVPLVAGTSLDLFGGTPDFNWTGTSLDPLSGTQIGIITGVTYENANYDVVGPAVAGGPANISDTQLFPGVIFGVITAEGNRAVMRVESRVGTGLNVSYRVYGN